MPPEPLCAHAMHTYCDRGFLGGAGLNAAPPAAASAEAAGETVETEAAAEAPAVATQRLKVYHVSL